MGLINRTELVILENKMEKIMLKKYLLFFLLILLVVNCSDKNDPVSPEKEKTLPELNIKEIEMPQALKNSSDTHAQMARGYISIANSFNVYSYMWNPPTSSNTINKVQDEWTKTWKDNATGVEIKLVAYDNSTEFGWTVYISGNMEGVTLNNQKVMEAKEIKATKSGSVHFYDFTTQKKSFSWTYSTNPSGLYTVDYLGYKEDGTLSTKFVITSNPDNSGSLDYYEIDGTTKTLAEKITWNADGTGSWTQYDSAGNILDSGSF